MNTRQDEDPPSTRPTGRRLVLMRHAKAAWPDEVTDHERPLSTRGRGDARAMGEWLAEVGWVPDLVVASDALRTRQTAELVIEGLGRTPRSTSDSTLYECGISDVLDRINATGPEVRTLLVIGHEPTMSATTAVLTGRPAHFSTAALARVEIDVPWGAVEGHTGDLVGLRTPKD